MAVTRLGISGFPRPPYGSFVGKAEASPIYVPPDLGPETCRPTVSISTMLAGSVGSTTTVAGTISGSVSSFASVGSTDCPQEVYRETVGGELRILTTGEAQVLA